MEAKDMVGRTYKHVKGGVYKVLGVHWMDHHWEGVEGGRPILVVRYTRVQYPDGGWDSTGEEYLRPLEDWETKVWWPTAYKMMKRFVPILEAVDAEEEAKG